MLNSVIVAATLLMPPAHQAGTRASDGRSYVTGYFDLQLDGVKCGLVQSAKGGDARASVLTTRPTVGVGGATSTITYSGLEVQMGLSMGQPMKDWIDASLAMNANRRKSGEVRYADFKREVRQVREFKDALLTEIGFPACDSAAKDPAFMTLKFSPWIVRNKKGDGSKVDNPADMAQKQWHPTDFRFTIDGLEKATAKVSKVDSISIKQTVTGDPRSAARVPGRIEYPNIVFYVPAEFADTLYKWHQELVINKNNTSAQHKSGSLVYLNRTRQKELLTLSFSGLGIFKIAAAPRANNKDTIAQVRVEMYCEAIKVVIPSLKAVSAQIRAARAD